MDYTGMTPDQLLRIEAARRATDITKAKARTGGPYDTESVVQLAEGFYGFLTNASTTTGDQAAEQPADADATSEAAPDA